MLKKFLSIIIAAVLSVAVIPASLNANAASIDTLPSCDDMGLEGVERDGDFQYTILDDGTASVYRYYGKNPICTIPEKLGGKTVSTIGEMAFSLNSLITGITIDEVKIPNTVKKIENAAFSFSEISKLHIPASVEEIGYVAFSVCGNLKTITVDDNNKYFSVYNNCLYNKDKTEIILCAIGNSGSMKIADNCTTIDAGAFIYCVNLKSIDIPESVTTIGEGAFSVCTGIKELVIPNKVTKIEKDTFANCTDMKVTLPRSIASIDDLAFEDSENCTILCYKNSVAHRFAMDKEINYKLLSEEPKPEPIVSYTTYGDMDGDEKITSADSLTILRMSVNLVKKTEKSIKFADVDDDGSVTSADSLEVLRYSVHLSKNEKIGQKAQELV